MSKTKTFYRILILFILFALSSSTIVVTAAPAALPVLVNVASSGLPLLFIENVGQFDPAARFQVRSEGRTIWFTPDTIRVHTPQGVNLGLDFFGGNLGQIEPFAPLETRVSYFTGAQPSDWYAQVPVWTGIRYRNLYPGIDLEISGQNGQLHPQLVLHPGADLHAVRLSIQGARAAQIQDDLLQISTSTGHVTLPLFVVRKSEGRVFDTGTHPHIAFSAHGVEVSAPFATSGSRPQDVSGQDMASALLYSTFFGGSEDDRGWSIAVDSSGAAYITGSTCSEDLPTTPGAYDQTYNGGRSPIAYCEDVFVAKLSSDGGSLAYATFIGGSEESDWGRAIAVDGDGYAYITGVTASSDFPTTPGAYDRTHNDGYYPDDVFVTKLNPTGTALVYSTFVGGSANESGADIALDGAGSVYVTGGTTSSDFPTTDGAFDPSYNPPSPNGESDVFCFKLDAEGSSLAYSTYLGSGADEYGTGIAVDGSGHAHIVGSTNSAGFPVTSGAFDIGYNGSNDLFVAKFSADGSALEYASFLGGTDVDGGADIALDTLGQAYLTGSTQSFDFPTTGGAYDSSPNGKSDAFVAKMNAAGSELVYSTLIGGQESDSGVALAVDAQGHACLLGHTSSVDFPVVAQAYDCTYNGGGRDLYVLRLAPDGDGLEYATFIGSSGRDSVKGIAVDESSAAYLTGYTDSDAFPTTDGAYDTSYHDEDDAFVSKIVLVVPTSSDVDAWIDASSLAAGPALGIASIPIRYGNLGQTTASSVVLTATLDAGLIYDSDTSGVVPTINGNLCVWFLADLDFAQNDQFMLAVRLPNAPVGSLYRLTLVLDSAGPEGSSQDNAAVVEVMVADLAYLPMVLREGTP